MVQHEHVTCARASTDRIHTHTNRHTSNNMQPRTSTQGSDYVPLVFSAYPPFVLVFSFRLLILSSDPPTVILADRWSVRFTSNRRTDATTSNTQKKKDKEKGENE